MYSSRNTNARNWVHLFESRCISGYEYELSLKMACMAETWCWWFLIDKAVFRLDLHFFYPSVTGKLYSMYFFSK